MRKQYKLLREKYNVIKEEEDSDLIAGIDATDEFLNTKVYYLCSVAGHDTIESGTFEEVWEQIVQDFTSAHSGESFVEGEDKKEEAYNLVMYQNDAWSLEEIVGDEKIDATLTKDKQWLLGYVNRRFTKLIQEINAS